MSDLKPCPFCGGEGAYSAQGFVFCRACGCEGAEAPIEGDPGMARRDAIAAWNARPSLEPPASDVAGWRKEVALIVANACLEYAPLDRSQRFSERVKSLTRITDDAADRLLAMPAPPHPAYKEPGDE